ncbi:MAG TPA: amidohydrolase family protein [Chloroflexota bacterium]|nr:amidohydrolase family protein [Chloroflexota bacterium]
MPFEDIALFDNHAHPWLRVAEEPFALYFSEAPFPQSDTLFYRSALRELAAFIGCSPDEVASARNASDYAARLVRDANVSEVLLDDGFPRVGAYSVADCATLGGFKAHRVLRLERLAEDLLERCASLSALEDALLDELARADMVALKSIVAYRSGLAIEKPDAAAAARGVEPGRLIHKPLLDYLFHVAAQFANDNALPLHVHSGFGDRDLDLRLANPLHLRPLLESGVIGTKTPLVLLHTSYPYVREAAYLASVYPNVYVDLSQASPLLAGPALTRAFEELLGLAPVTRLLYGSDAWGIPDWLWLAARATRGALHDALAWLAADEARWAANRILHDNASELYA